MKLNDQEMERFKHYSEASTQEMQRREAEWEQAELEDYLLDLQQARQDFNQAFHGLSPTREVVELWDQLQLWIDKRAKEIMGE